MHEKSPWLAVSLNWLLPGSGYLYAGRMMLGCITFVICIVETIVIFWTFLSTDISAFVTYQVFCLALFIQILISIHTYKHSCERSPQIQASENERIWFAVFLSMFIPGLGYGYLRKWGFLILSQVLLLILLGIDYKDSLWQIISLTLFTVLVFYHHAYTFMKKEEGTRQGLRFFGFVSIYATSLFFTRVVAFALTKHILFTVIASGGDMEPTFESGDMIVVNKLVYQNHDPQVGDIVVFDPSESFYSKQTKKSERAQLFAKRVVAVAGEQVDLRSGELLINGESRQLYATASVQKEYKKSLTKYLNIYNSGDHEKSKPYPNWGDRYGIIKPYTVPSNSYFVMGDNLLTSRDSRHVGAISRHTIKGKAIKIYWPPKAVKKNLYDFISVDGGE